MRVDVLGPIRALDDGGGVVRLGGRMPRTLLARLVTSLDTVVPVDTLVDDLWGERPPATARQSLQVHMSQLRKTALRPHLRTEGGGYRLALGHDRVDAAAFEELVTSARAVRRERPHEASSALRSALDLWRGAPFGDTLDRPFIADSIVRLEELRLSALEERIEADLACGRHTELVPELRRLTSEHPLRERLWHSLILSLYRAGRQADALRAYQEVRARLADELGIEPGDALRALEIAVLQHAPALEAPVDSLPARVATLPRALAGLRNGPFVGRDKALGAVLGSLRTGADGTRVVVVAGEAGIGKTRLIAEAAAELGRGGTFIAFGGCDEQLRSPFHPIAGMLSAVVDDLADAGIAVPGVDYLARLLPELVGPGSSQLDRTDPETDRLAVFDAAVSLLRARTAIGQVTLIVDDAHWASAPALELLWHLCRRTEDSGLAVVIAARSGRPDRSDAFVELMGRLARLDTVTYIDLRGLREDEVAAYVAAVGTDKVARRALELAPDLVRASGGNPFFLAQAVRHLNDGRAEFPRALTASIEATMQRLAPDARRALENAAVLGLEFDLAPWRQLTGRSDSELLEIAEGLLASGLVAEDTEKTERFTFVHALARDVIYRGLSTARRARTHSAAARALVTAGAPAAAIAMHYLAGHPDDRGTAVGQLLTAADHERGGMAYESAIDLYREVLSVLEAAGESLGVSSFDAWYGIGESYRRLGSGRDARSALVTAANVARGLGRPSLLALAAIALATRRTPRSSGGNSQTAIALLEESLDSLGPDHAALRGEVMCRLAIELPLTAKSLDRRIELTAAAQEVARQIDDTRLDLLSRSVSVGTSIDPAVNAAESEAFVRAAFEGGATEHEYFGRIVLIWSLTASGRLAAARREIAQFAGDDRLRRLPDHRWWVSLWRASAMLNQGDVERAATLIAEAEAVGREVDPLAAAVQSWCQQVAVAGQGGHCHAGLVVSADAFGRRGPERPVHPLDIWVRWATGAKGAVCQLLERTPALQIDVPLDGNWLAMTAHVAEAVAGVGDTKASATYYERLLPFSGRYLVMGFGGAISGSVDRTLGLLAAALGRHRVARRHLDDAARSFAANGVHGWHARTERETRALR